MSLIILSNTLKSNEIEDIKNKLSKGTYTFEVVTKVKLRKLVKDLVLNASISKIILPKKDMSILIGLDGGNLVKYYEDNDWFEDEEDMFHVKQSSYDDIEEDVENEENLDSTIEQDSEDLEEQEDFVEEEVDTEYVKEEVVANNEPTELEDTEEIVEENLEREEFEDTNVREDMYEEIEAAPIENPNLLDLSGVVELEIADLGDYEDDYAYVDEDYTPAKLSDEEDTSLIVEQEETTNLEVEQEDYQEESETFEEVEEQEEIVYALDEDVVDNFTEDYNEEQEDEIPLNDFVVEDMQKHSTEHKNIDKEIISSNKEVIPEVEQEYLIDDNQQNLKDDKDFEYKNKISILEANLLSLQGANAMLENKIKELQQSQIKEVIVEDKDRILKLVNRIEELEDELSKQEALNTTPTNYVLEEREFKGEVLVHVSVSPRGYGNLYKEIATQLEKQDSLILDLARVSYLDLTVLFRKVSRFYKYYELGADLNTCLSKVVIENKEYENLISAMHKPILDIDFAKRNLDMEKLIEDAVTLSYALGYNGKVHIVLGDILSDMRSDVFKELVNKTNVHGILYSTNKTAGDIRLVKRLQDSKIFNENKITWVEN